MRGSERTAEAVRRTIGSGQARLYRDLAAVLSESPADRVALGALILDAHCGDFDPYRAPDGDPAEALRRAIADVEVAPATRMLLETVLAQHLAGDYQAADDADLWVARLLARHRPIRRAAPARPRVIEVPRYRGKVTPRLAEVYASARAGIDRGAPPTSSEIAAALGRPAGDVRAAISNLIALGLLVEVGADRALDLGAVDA